jgi:dTDP-4-amino-4,6-dideoxygalactose transaminase
MSATAIRSEQIPVFKPLLEQEELDASAEALRMGWLGMGSYVADFERGIGDFLGAEDRHVVAVSTGHAALHLSLMLMDVGPGDEVITPSFNNITDFQAILATGATPVLADVDDETLCLDLAKAEELVAPRTKAVIVTDYALAVADHDAVAAFAERHGVRVLHDAAHSFGSLQRGRMVGSFSDIAMFSFDPVKTITSIDGGAIVVRTESERDALHELRLVGMGQKASMMYRNQRAWTYDVKRLGFRYHLANLHAAIGLAQLAKMDRISRTRRETVRRFNAAFAEVPEVRVPPGDFEDVTPFLYYVRVPAGRRDALREHLTEQGVDTGIHWQPGHWFSLLRDRPHGDLSVTERVGTEILTLPLHSAMAAESEERVVAGVRSFFEGA